MYFTKLVYNSYCHENKIINASNLSIIFALHMRKHLHIRTNNSMNIIIIKILTTI